MSRPWEETAMQIILHGGNARALAYDALAEARKGEFAEADRLLGEAEGALKEAHHHQTSALQGGGETLAAGAPLLLVHAQDHLMTAMAEKNLIAELILLYRRIEGKDDPPRCEP